ncbi:hypothetical protein FQA91_06410 [Pseudomonas aeruginosa]|nr:hypothetical protein FQA91_06410 [Pseudomonas aeruginosa]
MGGRITVESVVRCSWNGWPDDRGIRIPAYGPSGSRCKGGMISIQAWVRNVRTLFQMQRKMTNG